MASCTARLSTESGVHADQQAGHASGELVLDAAALAGGHVVSSACLGRTSLKTQTGHGVGLSMPTSQQAEVSTSLYLPAGSALSL